MTSKYRIFHIAVLCSPLIAFGQLSFEPYEGYSVGPLESGAIGVDVGSASVTNLRALDGGQSVMLADGGNGLSVSWPYEPLPNSAVTYASIALDAPVVEGGATYELAIGGAYLSVSQSEGNLSVSVYDVSVPVESGLPGQAYEVYSRELGAGLNWSRLTIRFDHQAGYFDCYVDGVMVAADFPMSEAGNALTLESTAGELYLDRLAYLGQPLDFEDVDLDGLPDDWEATHGLSLASNDRYADQDGDGDSNLMELIRGTNPAENSEGSNAASTADAGGVTIYLRSRGYFTLREEGNRSPLFSKF